MALEQKDFSKHSGVISYFRKTYIKTGIFPIEASDIISEAFELRSDSDYDDDYNTTKEEAEDLLAEVKNFIEWVRKFVMSKINL